MSASLEERVSSTLAAIAQPDPTAARAMRARIDSKTKPRGSLGRLEQMARRLAAIRGDGGVRSLPATIVVAAGDHGVAAEGVSAYGSEVTRQMLANFAAGGAAINVLARHAGADLLVVDAGVSEPLDNPQIRAVRIGPGTRNLAKEPAMERVDALRALAAGMDIADELAGGGTGIVGLGDMGIGNSTSAAAIVACLLALEPRGVCGRGTGLNNAELTHKVSVVRSALRRHKPDPKDPLGVLAALGGFEIAVLAGLALGAAAQRMPIVLDGFITSTAALVAAGIEPRVSQSMFAAHLSPEPGHRFVLQALGLDPLFDLGMRLGEGSGAALAIPLLQASLAVAREMATFESAGVSDAAR